MRPLILTVFDIVRIYYIRSYLWWLIGERGGWINDGLCDETFLKREHLFEKAFGGVCIERLVLLTHDILRHITRDVVHPTLMQTPLCIMGKSELRDYILGLKPFDIHPDIEQSLQYYMDIIIPTELFRDGEGLTCEQHCKHGTTMLVDPEHIVTEHDETYAADFTIDYI